MQNETAARVPTFIYGTAWKEEKTASLVEQALRAGFRAIDAANQRKHYNEAAAGEALAAAYRAGITEREELFLQTKYTYRPGQDHRLPYDPAAPLAMQVAQSLASSLEHLGTDFVDSFVLHGPASPYGWTAADAEVWQAMQREREAGRARVLGVSNVSLLHLDQMLRAHGEVPRFVQNRCFARFGWDREIRAFCREHGVIYQGFSLLTANIEVLQHPAIHEIARQTKSTIPQIIFAFARAVEILPLTGTSDAQHMKEDLASLNLELPREVVNAIERLAG